jgi:CRISPR-associated protein Cas1
MGQLVLQRHDVKLRISGGQLALDRLEGSTLHVPLGEVDALLVVSQASVTTPALHALARSGVTTVFADVQGTMRWCATPGGGPDAELVVRQATAPADVLLDQARRLVAARFDTAVAFAKRHHDDHRDVPGLADAIEALDDARGGVADAPSLESLRGVEGNASRLWWRVFATCLRGGWTFDGRHRQPAPDPVNAVLSFLSSLATAECTAHLTAAGLCTSLGTLHAPLRGRPSLACDVVEPFRTPFVEALALRLLNLRMLSADSFVPQGGGIRMSREGREVVLAERTKLMAKRVVDPRSGDRTTWRRLLLTEARRYAVAWRDGGVWEPPVFRL